MNLDKIIEEVIDKNLSKIPSEIDTSFYIQGVKDCAKAIKEYIKQEFTDEISDEDFIRFYI